MTHLVLLLGVALFALPVWLVIAGSTQPTDVIARGELSLIPDPAGLGVYADVLREGSQTTPVWRMLLVSFGMAMCIAIGKIAISVLSAYAVAFFRFPFRNLAFWTIFLTLMLPVEVRIIPTYSVMAGLGLINTFTGLTMPLACENVSAPLVPRPEKPEGVDALAKRAREYLEVVIAGLQKQ